LRHDPGHVIDIVPTVMDAAGVPQSGRGQQDGSKTPIPFLPGKSLLPAFARDGSVHHDALWWEHEGNRAVRVGDWKLVAARDRPWELYDMATDLAGQQPEKVRELAQRWQRLHEEFAACARDEGT
jgi:arylsulfatase A-like enzyme